MRNSESIQFRTCQIFFKFLFFFCCVLLFALVYNVMLPGDRNIMTIQKLYEDLFKLYETKILTNFSNLRHTVSRILKLIVYCC